MDMNLEYELLQYCKTNIEFWDALESRALGIIDRMRCPLQMASPELASEMESCIEEYFEDRDMEWPDDIDVDDVFWASEE